MAWPINGDGNPFGFQQGVNEGFETYYGGGGSGFDAYPHQNPAPVFAPSGPVQVSGPVGVPFGGGWAASPVFWVAAPVARKPSVGYGPIARTPTPSSEPVVDWPSASHRSDPQGQTRAARKLPKAPEEEPQAGLSGISWLERGSYHGRLLP